MSRKENKENGTDALGPSADRAGHEDIGAIKRAISRASRADASSAPSLKPACMASKGTRKRALEEIVENGALEQFVDRAKKAIRRGCAEMGIRKYASISAMAATAEKEAMQKTGKKQAIEKPVLDVDENKEPVEDDNKPKTLAKDTKERGTVLTEKKPALESDKASSVIDTDTLVKDGEALADITSSSCDTNTSTKSRSKTRAKAKPLRRYPPFDTREASRAAGLSSEATVVILSSEANVHEANEDEYDEEANISVLTARASEYEDTSFEDPSCLESQLTLVAPSSPILRSSLIGEDLPESAIQTKFDSGANDDLPITYGELAELLFEMEQKYCTGTGDGLMRHPKLSGRMRPILVDWLSEVAADYRMHRQTLHLTVQYLDRFLTHTDLVVEPSMLQCYGTACLSIAIKAEEQRVPALSELTDFSKDAFTRDQLRQAEIDVLEALEWHIAAPTLFEFLSLAFQRAAAAVPERFADPTAPGEVGARWRWGESLAVIARRFDTRPFLLACDYADALLHHQESQRFLGSELAAACFYLGTAPCGLDGHVFRECTGYSFAAVWPAIAHVQGLKAQLRPHEAIGLCAQACCESKNRYAAANISRIRADEIWAIQPHHAHLLNEFEEALSATSTAT
ncbi:G1/S-specific cyclin-E2 [Coemansia sp. Benny D115]|nr:G1/S-specific cyclin-E2 [Coemansia sp. Benny D115]